MKNLVSKISYNNLDRIICGLFATGLLAISGGIAYLLYATSNNMWAVFIFLGWCILSAEYRTLRRGQKAENWATIPGSPATNPEMRRNLTDPKNKWTP